MSKRIGIITIQKCDNFGADLQAYALGAKLRSLGYDAENIDYLFYKHPRHLGGKDEKPVLPLSLVNRVKERLFPILASIKNLKHRAAMKARHERFAAWTDKYLKCCPEYRSVASLYASPPQYDVYMVGSDQVWNPRLGSNILPYFLDFAPKGAKCVSYASSLGVSELPGGVYYKYAQWLKRFSAISVREKRAADILKSMALGVEIKHVVDPTLLLNAEEWLMVGVKPEGFSDEPYLLLYDLIASPETVALARRWANEKGLRMVRAGDGAYGPGEFIWLLAHADCVVTNSFHGTAFAVNNSKPFFSVIPRGMANASRIESLLNSVGLMDRLIRADNCATCDTKSTIDYAAVSAKLAALRQDSVDYLIRAIEQPAQHKTYKLPLGCYAVWNADSKVRAESTSGGTFRVVAESVLARGGIVYGAAFTPDFHKVTHQAAETVEALEPLMKSKYVWSDPTEAYKSALAQLKAGREVLFTGTACQIAAFKTLAKGFDEKLLTLDVLCHGTPRPEVFSSYIDELEKQYQSKLVKYEFRNKDAGWNFPHVKATFTNGATYDQILRNDPFYLSFGVGASIRPGCFNCPFSNLERVSDFTIADCWRIAASHPQYDDGKGTSLLLVNTPKAAALYQKLISKNMLKGGAYDLKLAQMRNMPLMQSAAKPNCYVRFNQIFDDTGSFTKAAQCFLSRKVLLKAGITYWVKKHGWFYFKRHQ